MDNKKWSEFYSSDKNNVSKIFIKVKTSDGEHFFFSEYDTWYLIKEYCEKKFVFIEDMHLQFRSNRNIIDIGDCDAVYFVRSALGAIGQPTKNYYTVGILNGDIVHKQMWLIPELILDQEYDDDLSSCFLEALIYNGKKENSKKQIQT